MFPALLSLAPSGVDITPATPYIAVCLRRNFGPLCDLTEREMALMASRGLTMLLCLLTVAGFAVSLGCAVSEERSRRHAYVIREDLKHLTQDIDWVLGLDDPSGIHEDSFPPGP